MPVHSNREPSAQEVMLKDLELAKNNLLWCIIRSAETKKSAQTLIDLGVAIQMVEQVEASVRQEAALQPPSPLEGDRPSINNFSLGEK